MAHVQDFGANDATTGTVLSTSATAVTQAGTLVVMCSWDTSAPGVGTVTVTDGGVNTYTQLGSIQNDATNNQCFVMFIAENITGGTRAITMTNSITHTSRQMIVMEMSGRAAVSLDQGPAYAGVTASTTPTTAAFTPSQTGEDIVAMGVDTGGDTSWTVGANYTRGTEIAASHTEYRENAPTGSQTADWTAATRWIVGAVTLRPSAAGAAPALRPMMLSLRKFSGPKGIFLGFPLPNFTIPTGGITYQPTGSLTPGVFLSGSDVFEATETGSLTPGTTLSGADVFQATEAGSLTPRVTLSGADVFTSAETGSLVAGVVLSGADVYTATEAGSLLTQAVLSGADVFASTETGSLTPGVSLSGADAFTASETGSLIVGAFFSGVEVKVTSGLYIKTGAITPGSLLSGADVFTATETGALITSALVSAVDAHTAVRAGSLLAGVMVSGASLYIPPAAAVVAASLTIVDSSTVLVALADASNMELAITDAPSSGLAVADSSTTGVDPSDGGGIELVISDTTP